MCIENFAFKYVWAIEMSTGVARKIESKTTSSSRPIHKMDCIGKFAISLNPILILYTEIISTIKSSPRIYMYIIIHSHCVIMCVDKTVAKLSMAIT